MKKLLTVVSLLVLISFGCSEQSSVVSPQLESNRSWIELPATNNSLQKTGFSVEEYIVGAKGGKLHINAHDSELKIKGKLEIPKDAFEGEMTITATVSTENTTVEFLPSPFYFDKNLEYSVKYKGVELDEDDDIEFGYMSSDGFVPVEYDQLIVDHERGILGVIGARIDHFSRFGFTR